MFTLFIDIVPTRITGLMCAHHALIRGSPAWFTEESVGCNIWQLVAAHTLFITLPQHCGLLLHTLNGYELKHAKFLLGSSLLRHFLFFILLCLTVIFYLIPGVPTLQETVSHIQFCSDFQSETSYERTKDVLMHINYNNDMTSLKIN